MADLGRKFEELKQRLLQERPVGGVSTDDSILLVYEPDQEREFLAALPQFILELKQKEVPLEVVNLETFPFEVLDAAGRLEDAFRLECEDYRGLRQNLADRFHRALVRRTEQLAGEIGGGAIFLIRTAALFPWLSYATLLQDLRGKNLPCRVVIAFPGRDSGAKLHFLNAKDGYNYLATRI